MGIIRDFDDQPNAQQEHEKEITDKVFVCTTKEYTLEPEIVGAGDNYTMLKEHYGDIYNWKSMTKQEFSDDWRNNHKSEVMLKICHDLVSGNLNGFTMPQHIQSVLDSLQGDSDGN